MEPMSDRTSVVNVLTDVRRLGDRRRGDRRATTPPAEPTSLERRRANDRRTNPDRRHGRDRRRHYGESVSIVIPARNEARNLPLVLPYLPRWIDEVILVDGHSTDDTVAVARRLMPGITVVHQPARGKGDALRAGFAAATGDIIVMLDADGSMDPVEIPAFVGLLLAGADFVKGSRFSQGGGTSDMEWYRRLGNWALTQVVRVMHGGRFQDLCYGYCAFWRRVLPRLLLESEGFEIETEMNVRALRSGLKVVEVPSFESARVHGVSSLRTVPDGWRVLTTIFREWARPIERRAGERPLLMPAQPPRDLPSGAAEAESDLSRIA